MKQLYCLFIVLALFAGNLFAQQPAQQSAENAPLSLEDCLNIGLERNFDLRIVRNEEIIARNNATRGNAGQLPSIALNGGYSGNYFGNNYTLPNDSTAGTTASYNGTLNAAITAEWTLFNGFSIQSNYARLQELKAMGELNTRMALEDFVANLSAEYYNYIKEQLSLANLKASLEFSQDRLYIVEASYGIGAASGLDYQQAQVDYNADHSAYITQLEVVAASRFKLNQLMALDSIEAPLALADTTIAIDTCILRDSIWMAAQENNAQLLVAYKNHRLSQLDLKQAQSRNYPYLKLNGGYQWRDNSYENSTYLRQTQMGPQFGITAGITLFDGMNRRREQQNARIQMENKQLQIEQFQLALKTDMANLWTAYTNNIKLYNIERDNQVVAQINFDIAMERYRLRELSGIELREAQLSLLESEKRLLQAEYNIKLCEISLLHLSGQILDMLDE
ncbi:MAG: TolC family protein [Bacteroidales bacterium]|nr:TolC family protein [Bacteroidales bacterium]